MTDPEYEALFLELLAGVNEGWTKEGVKGFLAAKDVREAELLPWLRRFGERLVASSASNTELAARMVLLRNLDIGEVGYVASEIGMQLLRRVEMNHQGSEEVEEEEEREANQSTDNEVEVWLNQGNQQFEVGNFAGTIASYDKAIAIQPDNYQAWYNRGIAAKSSVSCDPMLSLMSPIAKQNPALNQRGYEGELVSYEEGLKHCPQDTHPEGWGQLHKAIGNAHYFQGHSVSHPRFYWQKAVNSYNQALKTLKEEDFPELHLEVLQDLIRVFLDLGYTGEAQELRRRGTDLLRRLLGDCRSPGKKKQLELKLAGFQQLAVNC